jgi:uncharacterized membrane protein YedE/YeeE
MTLSTLILPVVGGLMIGLAAAALMVVTGRILGVSGIFSGLLAPKAGEVGWRLTFVAGLVVGGVLVFAVSPGLFSNELTRSLPVMALGGALVGFGARLGSGCTSGHGVCGIARLGPRSLVATLTFITTGALTTYLVNHVMGGAL